jgi:hypothetical protein
MEPLLFNYTFRQGAKISRPFIGFDIFNHSKEEFKNATVALAAKLKKEELGPLYLDGVIEALEQFVVNETSCSVKVLSGGTSARFLSTDFSDVTTWSAVVPEILEKKNLSQVASPGMMQLVRKYDAKTFVVTKGKVDKHPPVQTPPFCHFSDNWGSNADHDRCICSVDPSVSKPHACRNIAHILGANVSGHNYMNAICHPMVCDDSITERPSRNFRSGNATNSSSYILPRAAIYLNASYDGFHHDHAVVIKRLIINALNKKFNATSMHILVVQPGPNGKAKMIVEYSVRGNSTFRIAASQLRSLIKENDPSHEIVDLDNLDDAPPYGATVLETVVPASIGVGLMILMLATGYAVFHRGGGSLTGARPGSEGPSYNHA